MATDARATTQTTMHTAQQTEEFQVSNSYRQYVVWLLFIVYVFNFIDRQILGIVNEEIKYEFGLHDWQLGALGGLAFAVFYSLLGIPIARLADHRNRVTIITWSIVVWSAFTALTGFARSFWHLLIARIGVGIGEAGCSPPAYSIISDYFDPKKRATALAIYSMGVYAGSAVGLYIGGNLVADYGWRTVFFIVGVPGLVIALILKLTLREPPRGFSEGTTATAPAAPPFWEVLRRLWTKPSFRHLAVAAGLHAFVSYGVSTFYRPFFSRVHEMSAAEVGTWLAFIVAIGGAAGTIGGGALSDWLYSRKPDPRYYLWVTATTLFIVAPFGLVVYSIDSKYSALWMLIPYVALTAAYLAPSIAVTHRLVGLRERALASALLLLVLNLIGLGLGPMFTGKLSDIFKNMLVDQGVAEKVALGEGLQWAILVTVLINLWAATHYMLAARTLSKDISDGEASR
ncbi:MAG: spinster family MFS transporter [Steroidobacter sp.]